MKSTESLWCSNKYRKKKNLSSSIFSQLGLMPQKSENRKDWTKQAQVTIKVYWNLAGESKKSFNRHVFHSARIVLDYSRMLIQH